jgi:hypothetical protein
MVRPNALAIISRALDAAPVPVTVVANETNCGFPAPINHGLQLARGDHLLLLNNEVVVTDGWLDQLVALTECTVGRPAAGGGAGSGDPRATSVGPGTAERRDFTATSAQRRREADEKPSDAETIEDGNTAAYAGRNVTVIDFAAVGDEGRDFTAKMYRPKSSAVSGDDGRGPGWCRCAG